MGPADEAPDERQPASESAGIELKQEQENANKTTTKMRVRASSVDQDELIRLVQVEAMELPDLGLVVSGMAGRFPKSDSVNEFEANLREGRDMINDQDNARFTCGLWGLPPRAGRLNDLSRFDHEFFGFTQEEANYIDFQLRILYEVVYESILDAGVNPASLRGTNTGVFFGLHCNEFENAMADDPAFKSNGYYAQFAVKVAQYFDFRGLTLTFDAACASGFVGLHNAVEALRDGICDQAIVCSSNIPVHPTGSFIFFQMQMLSPTGYSRFLDSRADGYVKSEACVSILLQREQVAKRNYASFMATMTSVDGFKSEGITFPSDKSQETLIRCTKELARVSTNHVEYLEAHGTGTPAGDPQEARAISNVYYRDDDDDEDDTDQDHNHKGDEPRHERRRIGPLLVGSVKTNMGHSEAASGLCALVKAALMFENELIYRNLHFDQPNTNIKPLMDGRLKFVDEPLPLRARIIPLSCYGFGGSNVHVICRSNKRERITTAAPHKPIIDTCGLPRLVLMFGRGQAEIERFFERISDTESRETRNCLSEDFLSLIDSLSEHKIDRLMNYRGFCLLDVEQGRHLVRSVARCDLEPRSERPDEPVLDLGRRLHRQESIGRRCHLAFAGLGCQWRGMAAGLAKLRPFWTTIERAVALLEPGEGQNLVDFLVGPQQQESLSDRSGGLCQAFVAIVAYQMALVNLFRDTLRAGPLGALIGHSLGEVSCAYAAGLFDERETLMVAYQMGKTLDELGSLVAGKMTALVGLEWRQVVKLVDDHRDLYESLRVSCVNGPNSVTISGLAADIDEFLLVEMEPHKAALMVFEVSRTVALHNDFVMGRNEVRTALRLALERVLLPLTDYDRAKTTWLSSFLGDSERDQQLAKQANVDYFIEMLCRPINIVDPLERLEPDSIIYELSPSNSLESQVIQFVQSRSATSEQNKSSAPSAIATSLNRRHSSSAFGQKQQQQLKRVSKRKFHYVKSMQKNLTPEKQMTRLLSSLGELFQMGLTIQIGQLYASQTGRKPQFPVRRQTPSISSLIEWQHSSELFVPRYPIQFSKSSAKSEMPIDLVQDRDKYLAGHCVDGRVLYPATGYLLLVWRVFSFTKRKIYDACFQDLERELMPVEFRDVRLMRAVILGQRTSQLYIHFEEATGRFEVKEGGSIVVEGFAVTPEERPDGLLYDDVRKQLQHQIEAKIEQNQDEMLLNKDDVYKQFRLHGYDYGETFQCVESSSWDGLVSRIKFNGHFVSLTDSILQSIFLTITRSAPPGSLFLPTRFDYVRFQPELILAKLRQAGMSVDQSDGSLNTKAKREMMAKIMQRDGAQTDADEGQAAGETVEDELGEEQKELAEDKQQAECIFETYCDAQTGIIVTDGIEMRGVKASPAPRRLETNEVLLESYQFVYDTELPVDDERLVKFNSVVRPYGRACDSMSLELLMKLFKLETSSQLNGLIGSAGPGSESCPLMGETELEAYKRRHLECVYYLNDERGDDETDERQAAGAESSYDIKRNGKRTLMSVLDQLVKLNDKWQESAREKSRERLQMNRNHLLRDLLQASFTCERFIRPLVETVLENVCQKKSRLRLLEINPDDGILRPSLQQLVSQIEPGIALDYSLAHPNPGKLHGSQTAATTKSSPAGGGGGQPTANIKTYTLKPQQFDALFSDHQLKGLDLIVCKDTSCYRAGASRGDEDDLELELSRMLAGLGQAVAPSGYCLLMMRCQMTMAERVVLALNDENLGASGDFGQFALAVDQMNEQLAARCNRLLGLVSGDENQFGLQLCAQKSDPNGCVMLLFKRTKKGNTMNAGQLGLAAPAGRIVLRVRHDELDWLDELKASFKEPEAGSGAEAQEEEQQQNELEGGPEEVVVVEPKQVWLCAVATRENQISGLVGMMQSLRMELGSSRLRCFYDMFSFSHLSEPITIEQIEESHLFREALKRDHVWNCVDSSGRWGAFRHFTINEFLAPDEMLCSRQTKESDVIEGVASEQQQQQQQPISGAFVNSFTRGDLSSFAWFETPHRHLSEAQRRDQLVQVAYSALNFRDVMLATGRLPLDAIPLKLATSDCLLGLEFSGRDGRGRRVMGMVEGRGIATHVLCPRESSIMLEVPDWMSLREAATIPVVYATAIMAMICRGRMQRGESILIHAGSGGVGQAAIRIGLHLGLEVYTTVGSQEKRHFLLEQFGSLGLKREHIFDSRSCQFETDVLSCTSGRGVDMVLNSLADDKLQASLNCLAAGGRFLEIGKYDMSVNARLELLKLETNKSFHGILVDKLFDTDELNDTFRGQLEQVFLWLQRGLQEGFVKPIQYKLFARHQIEEAFRFMATGKHIGKVLIEIESQSDSPGHSVEQAVARPTVSSLRAVPRLQLSPDATFIVTGGLGGFGLELCKWLAQHGARQLVLTSRQGLRTGYQRATLRRLATNLNVEVRVVTEREIDASQLDGACKLLELARGLARGPDKRVGGIFHLAMVLRDSLLENMPKEDFELVLRPKVATCVALDEATRQMGGGAKLDYFVAFSSITSGKGNAGQANYAYANSCLERVCERRRSMGLHGLAIQWGAIGDVGVAFENLGGNEAIIGGTIPQRMPSCLATLARLLASPFATCLSVLPVNRNQEQLGERGDLVGAIMHVLGIKDPSKVSDESTLGDLGLDSLMAVEIRQYIEREHDITLNIQEIRALTIARIREIGDRPATTTTAERDGKPTKVGADEKPQRRTATSYGGQTVVSVEAKEGRGADQAASGLGQTRGRPASGRPRQQPQSNLAQLDKRLVRSFVPALELPADDFCPLNASAVAPRRPSSTSSPIFFLAPVHGRFDQLRSVCASIERPCIGLNWTRKLGQAASVDEAVEIYLNLLEQADWETEFARRDDEQKRPLAPKRFGERQVDLVGYSFGATIAFELMVAIERRQALHKARLERRLSNGSQRVAADLVVAGSAQRNTLRPGRLVLLDGSPKQIELGSQYLDELTRNRPLKLEDKVDELLLVYMMANLRAPNQSDTQLAGDNSNELVATLGELKSRPDLRQKVEFASAQLARMLAANANLRKQQATPTVTNSATARQTIFCAMEAFLRRYELINSYRAKWRLAGGCTLIRARELYLRTTKSGADKYEEDLELKSVVKGNVQLHVMSGDHESFMAENQREISSIIEQSEPSETSQPAGRADQLLVGVAAEPAA